MKSVGIWLRLCLLLIPLTACSKTDYLRVQGPVFGTYYRITWDGPKELQEPMQKAMQQAMQQVDASLSLFNPSSTLSRFNANTSIDEAGFFLADSLLAAVMDCGVEVSRLTGGAFDMTVGPLARLWGFGLENQQEPSAAVIDSILAFTGFHKIEWIAHDMLLRKIDPRINLDASSIAKGYAVDRVAAVLRAFGINNFLVDIGGEILASGKNPYSQDWKIGIQTPSEIATEDDYQEIVLMSNGAMATSGNYRNYRVVDGKKVGHTINPRTGLPAQNNLLSATVQAADCMTADAYATAFMVMGKDSTLAFLKENPQLNLQVLLIYAAEDGSMKQIKSGRERPSEGKEN